MLCTLSKKKLYSFTFKCTVWKLQNFSVTHILREIKFGDSESAKSAILTLSEALNFDIY